jgi:transcriptional regulator with XRE-family HTH domain
MAGIDRLLTGDRTRADAVVSRTFEGPTRTSQDALVEEAGFLRDVTRHLSNETADYHDRAIGVQLEARTDEAAKRSLPELLTELADKGFAWRDIARLVGVTVPALRKWRNGEPATGVHRRAVARLLAFVDVLRSDHLVQDPPSWMEMPLGESTKTGLDLYASGHAKLLLVHAAGHLSSDELLDRVAPDWRQAVDDRFEIGTATDGETFIRLKTSEPPE